jgi:hypothetical protein
MQTSQGGPVGRYKTVSSTSSLYMLHDLHSRSFVDPASQLWTTKYAPTTLKDICGNKTQVEKIQLWLHDWWECLLASMTMLDLMAFIGLLP